MRIAVGMFKHETNTFSPIPTRWEHFGPNGPMSGEAAYRTYRHSGYSMAGLLEAAEAMGGNCSSRSPRAPCRARPWRKPRSSASPTACAPRPSNAM